MKSTEESESPARYFWWGAISAISAVIRRNISMARSYYRLYPNLYVILVGPSGMRKSIPIALTQKLVERVDCTRVFSGRASIQAIVKALGRAHTSENKRIITDSVGFLVNPELDDMLLEDKHMVVTLLNLYDTYTKDKWQNLLKVSGVDNLKNVYLTIFSGSNETNLALALPKSATSGGLVARTCIVLEEKKRRLNALVRPPKIIPDVNSLSKRLFEISNLSGVFTFDNLAGEYFEKWYNNFMTLESLDKTGTLDRLPDTALKVAICISLSYKDDLVLLKEDIEEAIFQCQDTIVGMKKVFLGSGEHSLANPTAQVLRILIGRKDHKISRSKLLRVLTGIADAIDLDRIIDTLAQSGVVEVVKVGMSEVEYLMRESIAKEFDRLQ